MRKFLFLLLLLSSSFLSSYQYELTLGAIFQDEAPYLKEWIDFHRLFGVQRFYLYNNLSSDNYQEVLAPYIAEGVVELIDWNYPSNNVQEFNQVQISAYKDAIKRVKRVSKWMALIDTDEFLFPLQKDDLLEFLKDYESVAGIGVNWQMYGTSGVAHLGPQDSMLEKLTWKAVETFPANLHIKSIVRPEFVEKITNPHYVHFVYKTPHVNEDMMPIVKALSPYVSVNKIRINHYWTRDEYFLYNYKIPRRVKWQGSAQDVLYHASEMNAVEDKVILDRIANIKRKKGLL